jgi:uncharacterized membrane protein
MNLAAKLLAGGVIALGAFVYALAAHYTSAAADATTWAVVLAVAPILLGVGAIARHRLNIPTLLLVLLVLAGLAAAALPTLEKHVAALYLVQHLGINGFLGILFARTLRDGRTPLCTAIAKNARPQMSDAVMRYTRQVTMAWATFFACVTTTSAALFFFAPIEVWSAFANLMTPPLVALMFVGEYLVRRCILPRNEHRGFLATVRGYRATVRIGGPAVGGAAETGRS